MNPQRSARPHRLAASIALALAAGGAAAGGAPAASLAPCDLRCEGATDPLGVDLPKPALSWKLRSDIRGDRQSAWEIRAAATARELASGTADLWDSGRVTSEDTLGVVYGGKPLASSGEVFWQVRVWDRLGRPSAWTAPARFTLGLLSPAEWRGRWIAAPGATESLLLRREFEVRRGLKRALVHVCGLGQYELRLNGAKAGDDLLSPGWTDYDATDLYDTRDVTAMLHPGLNAAGLLLGNGIYSVLHRDRFAKLSGSFGPLRAILHLRLDYEDGTTEFVGTDDTWRTLAGPITEGNIYSGEDWDERLEPRGWDRPGFDDSRWPHAVGLVQPQGALRGLSAAAPPLRAIEVERPVSVRSLPDGSVLYDLGQNASHMPRIRVSGPAGAAVRLTPSEVLNPDGSINQDTMGGKGRGPAWWQYTKATDAVESWFPRFYYVGCRYLKAECFPPPSGGPPARLESIEGVVVHSSAPPVGAFAASNPLLGRIWTLVRWAQRSNMVSVLTDCPHREKLGWLEQYHLNGPAIRYDFDVRRIFAKGEHDMADAQTDEGLVPNIAPEFAHFKGTFRAAAEWGAAFILVPWQQYEFGGDADLLREYYPAMRRYFAYLESRSCDGILSEGLGDWYDLGPKEPGPAQLTPPPVTATAFFFEDASILSRIAAALGRPDEEASYAARAREIRESFNRRFFNRDSGCYAGDSQCANALALAFGLAERRDRPRVLAALVADVESRGASMTTGDIGFRFLLRALADGGRSDLVYRMIDQDEHPGYGYMLKRGETSLTESWDANLRSSHDHFMLGQITEWFFRDLAGIAPDPEGPGFRRILLEPSPVGDLAWVEASYDSVRGPISVRWTHRDGRFTLEAEIPANTSATVLLPALAGTQVLESGRPAARSPGVAFLRWEDGRAVFSIESGRYSFSSDLGSTAAPARGQKGADIPPVQVRRTGETPVLLSLPRPQAAFRPSSGGAS